MKKVRFYVLAIAALAVGLSCSDAGEGQEPPKPRKAVVIVLCDLSGSIQSGVANNNNMLDKMKKYVRDIPKSFPIGSKIFFYPVAQNVVSPTLVGEISYDEDLNENEYYERDSVNNASIDKIILAIDHFSKIEEKSCIFSSICSAGKIFSEKSSQLSPSEYDYEMIVISDMIENCQSTGITFHSESFNRLEQDIESFQKLQSPYDLGNLKINYLVIYNGPNLPDNRIYHSLEQAWEQKFKQLNSKSERVTFNRDFEFKQLADF